MSANRYRRLALAVGEPRKTAERAEAWLSSFAPSTILWVGELPPDEVESLSTSRLHARLGEEYGSVVLDLHGTFDPNLLGQAHGLVRGGGVLVLRLPPEGEAAAELLDHLAAHPYHAEDVGSRLWNRVVRRLKGAASDDFDDVTPPTETDTECLPTEDQRRAVERLVAKWNDDAVSRIVVTADRGRGKSSAFGMALRRLLEASEAVTGWTAVSARHRSAATEIFRFALGTEDVCEEGSVRFVAVGDLLGRASEMAPDRLLVDEAAQLSVPVLKRLVRSFPETDLAFATTTHGYEGTGRGFEHRFGDWLADQSGDFAHLELETPIRWSSGDPVEQAVFDALLLDAEPAEPPATLASGPLEHRLFDRNQLAGNERQLRQYFGLLADAHYRTTPADLHRMLDAPNIHLHGLLLDGDVVAATWAAEEGDLPDDLAEEVFWGRRIRGHALPEIFLANLSRRRAGDLDVLRSVRTAVHPELRRRGLATRLLEEVEQTWQPDLFGSLFGAHPGMFRVRRRLGHSLVRVSPSRGRRAGVPSVVMLRGASSRGEAFVEALRSEFAQKLPVQLEFLEADGVLDVDERLRDALTADLVEAEPLEPARMRRVVAHYADGPPTYESVAFAVEPFVEHHADALDELPDEHRRLIESRVERRRSWEATAEYADVDSVRAAMRGLRRALRNLVEEVAPESLAEGR